MKVVINADFGGFGLSPKAFDLYKQRSENKEDLPKYSSDVRRDDPVLVSIVEGLGEEVNDRWSCLEVIEVPDEYDYYIHDYDGLEHIVLKIKEPRLRELIRAGKEDDIVNYVKKTQVDYYYEDDEDEEETEC